MGLSGARGRHLPRTHFSTPSAARDRPLALLKPRIQNRRRRGRPPKTHARAGSLTAFSRRREALGRSLSLPLTVSMMRSRTKLPFTTIFAILIAALAVFWPVVRKLPPIEGFLTVPARRPITVPKSKVWINRRSGLYYCRKSAAYGKLAPGAYMDQAEANEAGYSPAANAGCEGSPVFGTAARIGKRF